MATSNAASSIKYSHTLWSPSDTIRDVAEVLGISNLPDEVSKSLAMEVEYRIHEVVEEAVKFMRHSRRTTLTTKDISNALRVMNVEPLYGYDTTRPLIYKEAMVGPGQTLYYVDDDDVDFEKIINQPLPKVPRATSFTAHWLAIEGVQPTIPQNPLPSEVAMIPPSVRGSQVTHSVSALASDVEVKPLVKHVISKELQIYFDKVVEALLQSAKDESNAEETEDGATTATANGTSNGGGASLRSIALNSLRNDPGLHQLVPYLVQFVQEQISQHLKSNLNIVNTMLEVIYAMLQNPNIFIEPYIHQIMPCLLTPLLSKRVGPESSPSSTTPIDTDTVITNNDADGEPTDGTSSKVIDTNTYAIRDFAASLISRISEKYSDIYYSLKPRVTRTLLKGFMDVNRTVPSWYGSIAGIKGLGSEVVRVVIVGNLKAWYHGVLPRITDTQEQLVLTNAIIDALRKLKADLPDLYLLEEQQEHDILTPEDEQKVKQLVGEKFFEALQKEKDGNLIAKALIL